MSCNSGRSPAAHLKSVVEDIRIAGRLCLAFKSLLLTLLSDCFVVALFLAGTVFWWYAFVVPSFYAKQYKKQRRKEIFFAPLGVFFAFLRGMHIPLPTELLIPGNVSHLL
jgi:hypothetical protein